jgi:Flp pilus assembly pilin Flp
MFAGSLPHEAQREDGQGMTEYALVLGSIAVLVVVVFVVLQNEIVALIDGIAQAARATVPPPSP